MVETLGDGCLSKALGGLDVLGVRGGNALSGVLRDSGLSSMTDWTTRFAVWFFSLYCHTRSVMNCLHCSLPFRTCVSCRYEVPEDGEVLICFEELVCRELWVLEALADEDEADGSDEFFRVDEFVASDEHQAFELQAVAQLLLDCVRR